MSSIETERAQKKKNYTIRKLNFRANFQQFGIIVYNDLVVTDLNLLNVQTTNVNIDNLKLCNLHSESVLNIVFLCTQHGICHTVTDAISPKSQHSTLLIIQSFPFWC